MIEYDPAKTGGYLRISPNFPNCLHCEKDLKDNKDNSLHLRRKYVRIFVLGHYLFLVAVLGHYLFLVAHSFPQASLSENCSLLGTDVHGQISEHIFAPNGSYCLYIFSLLYADHDIKFYYTLNSLTLFWLVKSVQWIFEISAHDIITTDYTIIMSRSRVIMSNLKPWRNGIAGRRKLRTWVYLEYSSITYKIQDLLYVHYVYIIICIYMIA